MSKSSDKQSTYSADEAKTIKKLKRQEKRRRLWGKLRVLVYSAGIVLVLVASIAVGFANEGTPVAVATPTAVVVTATPSPAPVFVMVTATPTAAPDSPPLNSYQAHLPDVPLQTVVLIGDVAHIGRVGYMQHDGAEWRYYPYCTAVPVCQWPMQPPNPTYRIFVEYGGMMNYYEADPLDPAVDVKLWLVVREELP